jgi:hypothetical protein
MIPGEPLWVEETPLGGTKEAEPAKAAEICALLSKAELLKAEVEGETVEPGLEEGVPKDGLPIELGLGLPVAASATDDPIPGRLAPGEEGIPALALLETAELAKAADTAFSQSLPKGVSSVIETTLPLGFKASLRKPPELL